MSTPAQSFNKTYMYLRQTAQYIHIKDGLADLKMSRKTENDEL